MYNHCMDEACCQSINMRSEGAGRVVFLLSWEGGRTAVVMRRLWSLVPPIRDGSLGFCMHGIAAVCPPTAEQGGTQHVPVLQYKCMDQCHVQLDRPTLYE